MRRYATTISLSIVLGLTVLTCPLVQAQTFNVIHAFTGGQDGAGPYAGLTMDRAGNLYGTASAGGKGFGTVFKLALKGSGWVFTPLYSFQGGTDGALPGARVILGPDGSLYGTTYYGGSSGCGGNGCGTVFNLKPQPRACKTALCPWTETVLYRFTGASDGAAPGGDLVFDHAGAIYGATFYGGLLGADCYREGCGVVYKLAPSNGRWTETALYSFTGGSDGGGPSGGVIFDQAGNLYGAAFYGGASNCGYQDSDCGTVYQLVPSGSGWTENTIFDFSTCCVIGPVGGLVFDTSGNLYGAASSSPNPFGNKFVNGSVYEIQNSNNNWTQVFDDGLPALIPADGVIIDAAGNLYGVADDDGYQFTHGVVYELTASNDFAFTALYTFSGGNDGSLPLGTVMLDASGNLYGTASEGGAYG